MYIAIDVGGTNIRVASSPSIENPKFTDRQYLKTLNQYSADLKQIAAAIEQLRGSEPIDGIGICTPGVISSDKQTITVCQSITDWINKPVAHDLSTAFNCPVILENDAATAALGEAIYGAGKDQDFIFMIWGTGVGGSAVVHTGGNIYVYPFEPGHQILNWHGPRCYCGQVGCAQLSAGGDIIEYYQKTPDQLNEYEWQEVFQFFAHLLANVIVIRPSKLIVFGGGIALKQPARIEQVREIIQRRILVAPIPDMQITAFGDDVALYGALALLTGKMHS